MKKLLILCALLSQSAWAQDSAADDMLDNTSYVAAPQGQGRKPEFGISLFMIGGYSDQQFRNADPAFDVFDSYISFNYRITRDVRLSARPAFGYSLQGINKYGDSTTNKSRMRDFSFAASINNILEDYLPSSMQLKFKPRLYLPTSEQSKDSGQIAKLRAETELKYYVNSAGYFRFYAKPEYYFQRYTVAYNNSNPNRPNIIQTTMLAESEHGVEYNYDLNRTFSVMPVIAFTDAWSNTSDLNTASARNQYRSTSMFYGLGLGVEATRNIHFIVGVRTEKDLIRTDYSDETSYALLTDIILF